MTIKTCTGCTFADQPADMFPCKTCTRCWGEPVGERDFFEYPKMVRRTVPTSDTKVCDGCTWTDKETACCMETFTPPKGLTPEPEGTPLSQAYAALHEYAKTEASPARGLRYNKGKRRYDLIPPDALAVIADILTKGAEKYAPRNWELGMPYSDALASLERHLQDWKAGQDNDAESTLSHLGHVAINAIFLLTWQMRGVGEDDRVKVEMPAVPTPRA